MKNAIFHLTLAIAIWSSQCVFAAAGDVDLRNWMPPIRSQGDIGWCYANAAADLLSYRFRVELHGAGISAIYAALSYNERYESNLTAEGGFMKRAVKATLGHGFCMQSDDHQVMEKGLKITLKQKISFLNGIKKNYDEGNVKQVSEALKKIKDTGSIIDRLSRAEFFEVLEKSTAKNFLMDFADRICKEHTVPDYAKGVRVVSRFGGSDFIKWFDSFANAQLPGLFPENRLIAVIDEQIDQNNIVGISYYSGFLQKIGAGDVGPHASVIVGRRWSETMRQNEYIIRNSWGPACYSGKTPIYKWRCEGGHIFVGQDLLERYLYNVTYIALQ